MVDQAAVWVLFMNLPVNAFKDEGILVIAKEVGTLVSDLVKRFVQERRFVNVKVLIPVEEPVKDFVKATHPILGIIKAYCSYKNISRICVFCGKCGHEMAGCQDHARLALLLKKPGQEERFKGSDILAPKKGSWIVNPALALGFCVRKGSVAASSIHRKEAAKTGHKRSFEKSVNEDESNFSDMEVNLEEQQANFGEGQMIMHKEDEVLVYNKKPKSAGHNAPAPPP